MIRILDTSRALYKMFIIIVMSSFQEYINNVGHIEILYYVYVLGIIESDDISLISLEIEKALNFSKKAALLVESVKKKYGLVNMNITNISYYNLFFEYFEICRTNKAIFWYI